MVPRRRGGGGAAAVAAAAAVTATATATATAVAVAAGRGSGFKFLLSSKRARAGVAGPLCAARCRRGLQRENREGRAWTGGADARRVPC